MARVRCGYCGRYFDEMDMVALDNGSPACLECAECEEKQELDKQSEVQKMRNESLFG